MSIVIKFYDFKSEATKYNYVVIVSRVGNKWVWVRQHGANSWEIPAGHVEENETPDKAAHRELWEETGAIKYSLTPICDFAIEGKGTKSYNRLYYSIIEELGQLPKFEIEEVTFRSDIPEPLTHGIIQPKLIDKVIEVMRL